MANRTPRPPVWHDPTTFTPGQDIDGGAIQHLGETTNTTLADLGLGSIAQQVYPDGITWTGAAGAAVCIWRPLVSATLTGATISIDAVADIAGATVKLAAAGGADSVTLNVPLARGRVAGTVAIAENAGTGREQLDLTMGALGGTVTIYRITIRYTEAGAGPIATGALGDAMPLGVDGAMADGVPLSSGRAGRLVATQNAMLDSFPRTLLGWSDVAGVTGPAAAAVFRGVPAHTIRARSPKWGPLGSFPVYVRAAGDGVAERVVTVDSADSRITVPLGLPESWATGTAAHSGPVEARVSGVELRRIGLGSVVDVGEPADPDALAVVRTLHISGP